MKRTKPRAVAWLFGIVAAASLVSSAHSAVVTLDVPQLASQSGAKDFRFLSFNFNTYPTSPSGSCGDSDFCENIVANLTETYSYLVVPGCVSSGRGGHCGTPPPPYIATVTTGTPAADTYTTVLSRPAGLDVTFHFLGADAVGVPLSVTVLDSSNGTVTLTDSTGKVPLVPGQPWLLSAGPYTLEYQTSSITGFFIGLAAPVPEPQAYLMMLAGLGLAGYAGHRRGRTAPSY